MTNEERCQAAAEIDADRERTATFLREASAILFYYFSQRYLESVLKDQGNDH